MAPSIRSQNNEWLEPKVMKVWKPMTFPFQTGEFFPGEIAVSFLLGSSSSIASCWLSCVECWNHTFKKYWNQFGTSMPQPLAKGSFELFWGCIFGLVWSHVLGSTSWESGVFHIKKSHPNKNRVCYIRLYIYILYIYIYSYICMSLFFCVGVAHHHPF